MHCYSNQDSREPNAGFGVIVYGDTDIVSVLVRSVKVRFFGLSSRQRTTRTRGEVTRYRKMDFGRRRSGSGERFPPTPWSWVEHQDRRRSRQATPPHIKSVLGRVLTMR